MPDAPKLRFDVASALSQGKRETQEDAIVADFTIGDDLGVVVLSDGMGGHQAGEVASNIVVTEVYSELKLKGADLVACPALIPQTLRNAADAANACLRRHTEIYPETKGMGATLIALVQIAGALYWLSIGDSVLYLLRKGQLRKLNQDHSLAPQIDFLVSRGLLSEEAGRTHPDRNVLTSALHGEEISLTDCPDTPLELKAGDVVIAGSDGLPYLNTARIREILVENRRDSSTVLSRRLLRALRQLGDPEQDNICFAVIRAVDGCGAPARPVPVLPGQPQIPVRSAIVTAEQTAVRIGLRARLRGVFAKLFGLGLGQVR